MTGRGLFHVNVLPFGIHNSAASMQRLMNNLFGYDSENKVFVYLDDLIIATETFDEHCVVLKMVVEKLEMANLTVNFDKCHFCRSALKYLGFVVDKDGLRTDPDKVEAIVNFPKPRAYTELKRFIVIVSWYRRFVINFAKIASPLHDLTKGGRKHKPLKWTSTAEDAFMEFKTSLVSAPVLTPPDFQRQFIIHCDQILL